MPNSFVFLGVNIGVPPILASVDASASPVFIELGIVILGLAFLGRLANKIGLSSIPLYLVAGLFFGNGGIAPIRFGTEFLQLGSEVGVLLLLFMLGLEYTGVQLAQSLRSGYQSGLVDILLNLTPGFLAGKLMHWDLVPCVLLAGVTYVSSSGIIARMLAELGRMKNPETPTVVSLLVFEDLAMAVYLPVAAVIISGQSWSTGIVAISVAMATVGLVLLLAVRFGTTMSRWVVRQPNDVVLLFSLGLLLLVAGLAQEVQVSSAVGAFLVGVALSGPVVHTLEKLFSPLRDLFAAMFFLFFGLQIDPSTLPPVLVPALILASVTALTKVATGMFAVRRLHGDWPSQIRGGLALVPRGEFSIVIAGLGTSAAVPKPFAALCAAYVLLLAIFGPLLARYQPQ